MIYYVYEGHVWPAVRVQAVSGSTIELKFFPSMAAGLGDVVVEAAAYSATKENGTWHNAGD